MTNETLAIPRLRIGLVLFTCAVLLGLLTAGSAAASFIGQYGPQEFGPYSFESAAAKDEALTEPATQAGSHPYSLTVDIEFNHDVETEEESFTCVGHPKTCYPNGDTVLSGHAYGDLRDLTADLPPGLIVNPRATPVRCTQVELVGNLAGQTCPNASTVGVLYVHTLGLGYLLLGPVFNMVPPPGVPAEFGMNPGELGLLAVLDGGLRTGADNGLSGTVADTPQTIPFFGAVLTLWGSPSDPSHDKERGTCLSNPVEHEVRHKPPCPVERTATPFLTMPTACSGAPLSTTATVDSWQQPADRLAAPAFASPAITGCDQLQFEPEVEARPTTNVADAPSGLDFNLKLPQPGEPQGLAEAHLRDAVVTLPAGIAINPSVADGLATCTSAQIGYKPATTAPLEFTPGAPDCPNGSKIGSVEVTTPLLDKPLPGAVYLAAQGDNPFGSLMAIYIVINDPERGIVVKLAGHVVPDPETGQLVTTVQESPQLPFEEFQLHFFGGARGPLRTPATCGHYATTTELTPWSAPESGPPATPSDPYEISTAPGGGACPTSAAAQPNKPHFNAGTLSSQAGAYSPFVLKLSREDGSQELHALNANLPPGLTGRLAGVGECSEAQVAAARSREQEGRGAAELAHPSCPASSEVGTVDVAAGAGPDPFHVTGHAYLAGPYKGAPLSMVIVTPAIAGPFDLGTVVVRAPLYIDPVTAQITVKSDPIPTILDGIPLDVRSIAVSITRNQFILNPTNCEAFAITATAFAAGSEAALFSPFQVGGCNTLPFKPKLSLKLQGSVKRTANPALTATLTQPSGQANIARAQVKLPPSAFLDNAHIGAVCTRVQFAAHSCPSASVYGSAEARTPLLDYPLKGSVYLRSNPEHELPDLVVGFTGPATQPIEIALAGRTDSVKGALRNSFEMVPDVPVSSFRLSLFGGKRGLVEMSSGFCKRPSAAVKFVGQNGKVYDTTPKVVAKCPKPRKHKGHNKRAHR